LVGANPLFSRQLSGRVGGCFGPPSQLELRVDAADVVLSRLRADEQPRRDFGVGEALSEEELEQRKLGRAQLESVRGAAHVARGRVEHEVGVAQSRPLLARRDPPAEGANPGQ
jgi:hypothetical protein